MASSPRPSPPEEEREKRRGSVCDWFMVPKHAQERKEAFQAPAGYAAKAPEGWRSPRRFATSRPGQPDVPRTSEVGAAGIERLLVGLRRILFWNHNLKTIQKASLMICPAILEWP